MPSVLVKAELDGSTTEFLKDMYETTCIPSFFILKDGKLHVTIEHEEARFFLSRVARAPSPGRRRGSPAGGRHPSVGARGQGAGGLAGEVRLRDRRRRARGPGRGQQAAGVRGGVSRGPRFFSGPGAARRFPCVFHVGYDHPSDHIIGD